MRKGITLTVVLLHAGRARRALEHDVRATLEARLPAAFSLVTTPPPEGVALVTVYLEGTAPARADWATFAAAAVTVALDGLGVVSVAEVGTAPPTLVSITAADGTAGDT